jgi:hypothetical protein
VMVFGDTTTFQNTAFAQGGCFVQTIFTWLTLHEWRPFRFITLALLALTVPGAWRAWRRAPGSVLSLSVALFTGLYVAHTAAIIAARGVARPRVGSQPSGEAVIDCSHLSRCDPDPWQPDGLGGVVQNLMRKEYLPVFATRFPAEMLRHCKVAFLVAPAKSFTPSELVAYDEFVRRGGELFVCVGYEDDSGCSPLLQHFGFKLRNLPLGLLKPDADDGKIYFPGAWPVVAEGGDAEVLCKAGEYSLIVRRRCGRGKVVLVGDSAFFLNRNLEMAEAFNPENIEFFRHLVPSHEP